MDRIVRTSLVLDLVIIGQAPKLPIHALD